MCKAFIQLRLKSTFVLVLSSVNSLGPLDLSRRPTTLQPGICVFLYQLASARPQNLLSIPYQAPIRITPQHVALLSLQRRCRRPEARGPRSGARRRPTKRVP